MRRWNEIMPMHTALQQNRDKVQACARDLERLEERAGQLRNAMLQLLVQPGSATEPDRTDATALC